MPSNTISFVDQRIFVHFLVSLGGCSCSRSGAPVVALTGRHCAFYLSASCGAEEAYLSTVFTVSFERAREVVMSCVGHVENTVPSINPHISSLSLCNIDGPWLQERPLCNADDEVVT
jgi:hypothetical protein